MMDPITLYVSPSEMQYERGADYINFALKYPDVITKIVTDQEIPADLRGEALIKCPHCNGLGNILGGSPVARSHWSEQTKQEAGICPMCKGSCKIGGAINIEVKLARYSKKHPGGDAMGSVLNGHLAAQIQKCLGREEENTAVIVWGSQKDVYNSITETDAAHFIRSMDAFLADWGRYKEFKRTIWLDYNIPMYEVEELHVTKKDGKKICVQHPADEIMKLIIARFQHGNLIKFMNKNDGLEAGAGCLARVPTIGGETARGLLDHYGEPGAVILAARDDLVDMRAVKINGRSIGKKADAIAKVFWPTAVAM